MATVMTLIKMQKMKAIKHLQAAGRVSFPSALYHPYNIHAVGVQTESVLRRNRFSWQHIGRFTESVLRSVNNLEEQFHTAYYFYLMVR